MASTGRDRPIHPSSRTSLRDVARLAGVSVSTASRVLSGSAHPVGATTRARVMAAAERLRFAPNRLARALVTARSQTIAALVHDIADPYFGEILRGIEDAIGESGYSLLVASSDRDPSCELDYVRAFQSFQVDAIVFAASAIMDPGYLARLWDVLGSYRSRGGVVVTLSEHHYPAVGVRVDNQQASAMAMEYLVGLGHRRIGYISGPAQLAVSERRLAGYRQGLERAGLSYDSSLVAPGDFSLRGGRVAAEQLLQGGTTAILAANDMLAIGAIRELVDRGVAVPTELSVVGIDDLAIAEYGPVPLTSIRVPTTELGRQGGRLVLKLLGGGQADNVVLPPELIIRQSAGPPPADPGGH